MDTLWNIIQWFADKLPDSFVSTWIGSHIVGTAQAQVILSYVNYFVPVNHLATMMSVWIPSISAVLILYCVLDK